MHTSRWFLSAVLFMLAGTLVSCGGDAAVPDTALGEWGAPATLAEELRVGALESDEVAYMLGRITALVPDGEGGVYVFDDRVPAIRHFNAEGTYVKTIGAKGSGPGEYEDVLLGMDHLPDGRLIVRDPRNRRLTIYAPDGAFSEQWGLDSGLYTSRAMHVDRNGQVYVRIVTSPRQPDQPFETGLLRLDAEGAPVDTLHAPAMPGDELPPSGYFSVGVEWDLHPDGYVVVGRSDAYAIELRKPAGTVVLQRDMERVELNSEERAEWEAVREWQIETQGQFMSQLPPPTPSIKPIYRSIYAGKDGSIWVQRYVAAVKTDQEGQPPPPERAPPRRTWREPAVYDVFRDDGTFLGEVHVPEGVSLWTYHLDEIWATTRGEMGETYLVRMSLSIPDRS